VLKNNTKKENNIKWHNENKEKARELDIRWKQNNRDKINEQQRIRRLKKKQELEQ